MSPNAYVARIIQVRGPLYVRRSFDSDEQGAANERR